MPVHVLLSTDTSLPLYLKVVSETKLVKLLNSMLYVRQRRFLHSNGIALMAQTTQHPKVRFYNQDVRFEVIYKRFTINDRHLYIPIEDYAKYYIDYKMRMAASVAEMLGVLMLKYRYNEVVSELTSINGQAGYGNASINLNKEYTEDADRNHVDFKVYDKGTCEYLFNTPEEFEHKLKDINCYFIDSDTYDADYDLRNLVRARLVGNLTDYSLKYEVAYMSQFEIKMAAFLYGSFGASLKKQSRRKLSVMLEIRFYRMEDLITTDNMNINDNRCLQLILRGPSPKSYYQNIQELANKVVPVDSSADSGSSELIYNFIERHLLSRYSSRDDDNDSSYLAYYTFLKIADRSLLSSYIKGIKSMDDLAPDGFLAVSLRSTVFAALLSFDDGGFYKLQQIYVNTLRQCRGIESTEITCFNLRCMDETCNSPLRFLKRIFVYIMRTFNHENPSQPLTTAIETNSDFARAMYHIATNIIVIPTYRIFADYVTDKLLPFSRISDDEPNIQMFARSEGIRNIRNRFEAQQQQFSPQQFSTPPSSRRHSRRNSWSSTTD